MKEYETAKFAAEYIWNTFENPNNNKKEYVLELLESYINRKLDENGRINLFFISTGAISLFVKYCSQEATVFNAKFFDLIITKEKVTDCFVSSSEPIFEVDNIKSQGSK